jgi:hypothetical protein
LHSFGLYSRTGAGATGNEQVYRFHLSRHVDGRLISRQPPDHYSIDLSLLHEGFNRDILLVPARAAFGTSPFGSGLRVRRIHRGRIGLLHDWNGGQTEVCGQG